MPVTAPIDAAAAPSASSGRSRRPRVGAPPVAGVEPVRLVCFALAIVTLTYMVLVLARGDWIVTPSGAPVHTDFVMVYAAGQLALAGDPAAAWDWTLHRAAEDAVAGRPVPAYYGWHYPPPFLMVAAALAALPYWAAFATWMAVTLPLYAVTIRAIVADRLGWLVAFASPVIVPNLVPGQNGFLTAALVGGTLALLQRHPVAAGVCLGLLTYKPQYGVLFPLVLSITGRWTVVAAASATTLLLGAATLLVFGPAGGAASWAAFLHWLPLTADALLNLPDGEFSKFQSVFALVRLAGGGASLGWTVQIGVAIVTAAAICLIWRNKMIPFDLKAAALATGVLLATPYVYLYDQTVLVVAVAFLLRQALSTGFLSGERPALALVAAAVLVLPVLGVPVGLAGVAATLALVGRRIALALAAPAASGSVASSGSVA
ncbi:glycosyltransferase family 87 protein [Rhodoplanes azumiensis]|uniref:Glycosyltransferase family 87 protein n=1 Tax=Rhodoplanes azumiensis TaxID=1897628 RepID=A0ABW5AMF5_9BRAD